MKFSAYILVSHKVYVAYGEIIMASTKQVEFGANILLVYLIPHKVFYIRALKIGIHV